MVKYNQYVVPNEFNQDIKAKNSNDLDQVKPQLTLGILLKSLLKRQYLWMLALGLGVTGTTVAAPRGLPRCQAALHICKAALAQAQKFPATGQTTSYRQGDDGDTQAGSPLDYTDNGDGTITDNNTKLQWEKQSDDGGIHDKDNLYIWEDAFAVHVATLNADNFAGYNDWRVPNVKELQSIVNYENFNPAVSAVFNTNCVQGATVLTGSCTAASSFYWTSSAFAPGPTDKWLVYSHNGLVQTFNPGFGFSVRAVRDSSR